MTSPPSPPNRRRRRIVVAIAVLVLGLGLGWWWIDSKPNRITSEDFWTYLEAHPTLAACVKPLFVVVGRQQQFSQEILSANHLRRIRKQLDQANQRAIELQRAMEQWQRQKKMNASPATRRESVNGRH